MARATVVLIAAEMALVYGYEAPHYMQLTFFFLLTHFVILLLLLFGYVVAGLIHFFLPYS